jgi:ubiquinone/menaquinone biosynthesis C-methylase UbiE
VLKSNRAYYDNFAPTYEEHRAHGYHALIDRLEVDLTLRYASGRRVLEAGCGTGLILSQLASRASQAVGVDLSAGMLQKAHARGLQVVHAPLDRVPFPSDHFDVVCSFKVLPHVEHIAQALEELTRVLKPGGHLIAEFYNPVSLRYLIKRLKPPTKVGEMHDEAVYTRYDSLRDIQKVLPKSLSVVGVRGIRVLTPVSRALGLPALGPLLEWLEWKACDQPLLCRFGGFLAVVAQKRAKAWQ